MRVLTYNIHGCPDAEGYDPDGVLKAIRGADADLVALQEVRVPRADAGSLLGQLGEIGYQGVAHFPTLEFPDSLYGNALLSRYPFAEIGKGDLAEHGREPRGYIRAVIPETPIGSVEFIATHLGLGFAERRSQMRRLMELFPTDLSSGIDVRILAGDLNEWNPLSPTQSRLHEHFGDTPARRTFPSCCPIFCLDRIHVQPERLLGEVRALSSRASDHRPLLADLRRG